MHELQSRDRVKARDVTASPVPPEKPRPARVEQGAETLETLALSILGKLIDNNQLTWYGELKPGVTFAQIREVKKAGFSPDQVLERVGMLHRQRIGLPDIGKFGSAERAAFLEQEEQRKYYIAHGWVDWNGALSAKGREFAGDDAAEVMLLQRCRSKMPHLDFSTYTEGGAYERSVDPRAREEYDKDATREIVQERRRQSRESSVADSSKRMTAVETGASGTSKQSIWSKISAWFNPNGGAKR